MQNLSPPLLVIVGPTASGKSRLAMELAGQLNTEIISADSRLVYKGMDIGTAKPSKRELKEIKHYMIDLVRPDQSFSVGDYKRQVEQILCNEGKRARSSPLILAGGTGLYIKSILYGLWEGPPADSAMRSAFILREEHWKGVLYRELTEVDPESAARIHPNDRSKIIRALEVFQLTGKPLSSFHSHHRFQDVKPSFLMMGLRIEREELYRRIDSRVDDMIQKGWIEEVEHLIQCGYHERLPSMLSLGYNILSRFLNGLLSKDEASQLIKQETRNYAKRQMTWFNGDPNIHWIEGNGCHDLVKEVKDKFEELFRKEVIRR